MELIPRWNLYADFFYLTKSKNWLDFSISGLIEASFIWGDRRMFMQLVKMIRNELHHFSRRLSELSPNLPKKLKKRFRWVELSPEESISLQQAEQLFTKFSALTQNGKTKMSNDKFEFWKTFSCCETAAKLFSGSENFRKTFKSAFCTL